MEKESGRQQGEGCRWEGERVTLWWVVQGVHYRGWQPDEYSRSEDAHSKRGFSEFVFERVVKRFRLLVRFNTDRSNGTEYTHIENAATVASSQFLLTGIDRNIYSIFVKTLDYRSIIYRVEM